MSDLPELFATNDPLVLAKDWLAEARLTETNDPNAIALSTVDETGLPNVRMVLLKDITPSGFVFYTNYSSRKAQELDQSGKAAFLVHWKSLRRQIRVRGTVVRKDDAAADDYFASRSVASRVGAWASMQSQPLESREVLQKRVDEARKIQGDDPKRPPFWGGFEITPVEIEFWADGANRLHDRFIWRRDDETTDWRVNRLYP